MTWRAGLRRRKSRVETSGTTSRPARAGLVGSRCSRITRGHTFTAMDKRVSPTDYAGPFYKSLYKYKSLAGGLRHHVRDLIVNQALYFPSPAQLNDPFECKPHIKTVSTPEQQRRKLAGIVKRNTNMSRAERRAQLSGKASRQAAASLARASGGSLDSVGIYSLTSLPRDLLMWPHYADTHRGVCVRFDTDAFERAGLCPFPVEYAEQRPAVDPILATADDWVSKAVLTKGTPWAYEREWRLVEIRGAEKVVHLAVPTINGVLLGANISPDDQAEVLQWVKDAKREIRVAKASFHPMDYKLTVEQIA